MAALYSHSLEEVNKLKLQINEEEYQVSTEPLKDRIAEGIDQMLADKGGDHLALRGVVKGACQMGMSVLGLKKQDRNDDPIKIVLLHVLGLIFDGLEKNGLHLVGEKQETAALPEGEDNEHIN
jgi:hypothetical protein